MTFFVKYPPNGDTHFRRPTVTSRTWDNGHHEPAEWEPCTYGIEPQYANARRGLDYCKNTFDETGNPLYALEAFRLATSVKIYPPLWVIEFMEGRFKHAMTNRVSLDRAFGFSKEGLGKGKSTDPKTADKLRARNRLLCMTVFKIEGAGLSRSAACKALASLLSRLPDGTRLSFGGGRSDSLYRMEITGKGIEKALTESAEIWKGGKEKTADAAESWTAGEKRKLLAVFYPSELPAKFRN